MGVQKNAANFSYKKKLFNSSPIRVVAYFLLQLFHRKSTFGLVCSNCLTRMRKDDFL